MLKLPAIRKIQNCQVLLQFSSSSLYCLGVDGTLSVLDLDSGKVAQEVLKDPDTGSRLHIMTANMSSTAEWMAISTQREDVVWMYNVGSKKFHWKVPFSGHPTCLKCLDDAQLIVVGDKNEIVIYDVAHKTLDPWSKKQGRTLPRNYLDRYNRVYDIVQIGPHKFVMYTHYTFITLDTESPMPTYSRCVTNKAYVYNRSEEDVREMWAKLTSAHHSRVIRSFLLGEEKAMASVQAVPAQVESEGKSTGGNMEIHNKYSVILGMRYVEEERRLFVVESPWSKILRSFPGTLQVHKYGH